MYDFIYYKVYQLACFLIVPGSILKDEAFGAVILISVFEGTNVYTIFKAIGFGVFEFYKLNYLLYFLIMLGINYLYFYKNNRYEKVIEKYSKTINKDEPIYIVIMLMYCILTIYFI